MSARRLETWRAPASRGRDRREVDDLVADPRRRPAAARRRWRRRRRAGCRCRSATRRRRRPRCGVTTSSARARRRSSSGSATLHEPNDVNHRRAPARSARRCQRDAGRRRRSRRGRDATSARRAPSNATPGREQHVEEAVVLEAGLVVAVPQRVVQPGRALERRLPVQRGVDPGRHARRRSGTGAASSPPVRSLSRCSAAATSSSARPASRGSASVCGQLDVHRGLVVEVPLGAGGVDRGDDPAHVAGQVVEVAQRDLQPDQGQWPARRGQRGAPAIAPAPPVSTTETGRRSADGTSGSSVSRTTNVPTRSAYHSSRAAAGTPRPRRRAPRHRAGRSPRRRPARPRRSRESHVGEVTAHSPRQASSDQAARPRLCSWSAMISRCTSLAPSQIRSTRSSRKNRSATFSRM